MTDITHYLDEDGEIAIESGAGLRFAHYLTSIISVISHPQPVPEGFNTDFRGGYNRQFWITFQLSSPTETGVSIWRC